LIEFKGLAAEARRLSVLLKTKFGGIKLTFGRGFNAPRTSVRVVGDGWKVLADSPRATMFLAEIPCDLTQERFDKLKALGALPFRCQSDRYFSNFDKITVRELISAREACDFARKMVNRVVNTAGGEKCLVLTGRYTPKLYRTLIKYKEPEFFSASVSWDEFKSALEGRIEIEWSKASPDWVWSRVVSRLGSKKAIKLLKELSEDGFRRTSATILADN
jgi:hypothetical protein